MSAAAEPTEVLHLVGLDVQVGSVRRQRCAWCGAMLQEDDFAGMAWPLNEDGTDPGPPPCWPMGEVVAVVGGDREGFKGMRTVPRDEWPLVEPDDGTEPYRRLPDGCCALLDNAVTA